MNKPFFLAPLFTQEYSYISFSLTSERLDDYYQQLEIELENLQAQGNILLDLIVSNGIKYNRFVSLYFDGRKLNLDSYKNITDVTSTIENISNKFYSSHLNVIEDSVLTKPQKFLFKKKIKQFNTLLNTYT